jgi:hypothetical protein
MYHLNIAAVSLRTGFSFPIADIYIYIHIYIYIYIIKFNIADIIVDVTPMMNAILCNSMIIDIYVDSHLLATSNLFGLKIKFGIIHFIIGMYAKPAGRIQGIITTSLIILLLLYNCIITLQLCM